MRAANTLWCHKVWNSFCCWSGNQVGIRGQSLGSSGSESLPSVCRARCAVQDGHQGAWDGGGTRADARVVRINWLTAFNICMVFQQHGQNGSWWSVWATRLLLCSFSAHRPGHSLHCYHGCRVLRGASPNLYCCFWRGSTHGLVDFIPPQGQIAALEVNHSAADEFRMGEGFFFLCSSQWFGFVGLIRLPRLES